MARSNLLSCLEKNELLNQKAVSIDKLLDWGKRYEESGLINDAIDFYERAGAPERIEGLLGVVQDEGDAFLHGRILKILGRDAPAADWIAVGEKARELGKEAYAREAFKRGGLNKPEVEKAETGGTKSTPIG